MWERLKNDDKIPKKGQYYRHYKGNFYLIKGICISEATLEPMVRYKDPKIGIEWLRPLIEWSDIVRVEGGEEKRFTLVCDEESGNVREAIFPNKVLPDKVIYEDPSGIEEIISFPLQIKDSLGYKEDDFKIGDVDEDHNHPEKIQSEVFFY